MDSEVVVRRSHQREPDGVGPKGAVCGGVGGRVIDRQDTASKWDAVGRDAKVVAKACRGIEAKCSVLDLQIVRDSGGVERRGERECCREGEQHTQLHDAFLGKYVCVDEVLSS